MLQVAYMFDGMLRHDTICVCKPAASAVCRLVGAEDKTVNVTSGTRLKAMPYVAATDSTHSASGSRVLCQSMD